MSYMSGEASAFWIAEPGRGEIRRETLAAPSSDGVLVEALWSGISRGTEALVFAGRVPRSEWTRMRAPFQAGEFPAPVKYGYASVGRIVGGPQALTGRAVFVLHPHQTRYVVPASAVHALPEGVPPRRAVLAANLETALNVVWDAEVQPGDRVAVIGGGTVGCLTAWLAGRVPGCEVQLVDVDPRRDAVARAMGVSAARPDGATREADVVVHASGTPEGLQQALELAGDEARIVEASWFGDGLVPLPLGGAFHARRLTIVSSQVGRVSPGRRSRWDTRRRMQVALGELRDEALDVLITGESAFEDLPAVMARLAAAPGDTLCHCIRYSAPGPGA
jgi:2-desacetyl-2-hydroxyethyl bacteriochlorophyllide A dehydrogenase